MQLRDYQIELSQQGVEKLKQYKIVYLAMEVRTGKTLTSLNIAQLYGAKKVLFLTKKKAISSIKKDYESFGFDYELTVINDESMHTINDSFDLVIHDEHHRFGAFPKAGKSTKLFKQKYSNLPMIFLSGTPHPESYSQIYHQFWVSRYTPFIQPTFYKWAKEFVTIKQRSFGYGMVNDYSNADYDKIKPFIDRYMITYTQQDAGFTSTINEHFLKVKMKESTYRMAEKLKADLVIQGKEDSIVADTAVKLMQKLHQIYSGTIKLESGNRMVLDTSKAEFIASKFSGKKIGIFYKFIAEYDALKEVFGDDLTNDIDEFNSTGKSIALQIVSGREGISLKKADYLVYYNIDFSATSYWQSRDRLTTMDRLNNDIYWVFSESGIEPRIYKAVSNKKNFTSSVFKKEYGIKIPKQSNK